MPSLIPMAKTALVATVAIAIVVRVAPQVLGFHVGPKDAANPSAPRPVYL